MGDVAAKDNEDLALLAKTIKKGEELLEEDDGRVSQIAVDAFKDMYARLTERFVTRLSDKQRAWAKSVWRQISDDEPEYENLISNGLCPRGKEVPTPSVLQNLPKKPPPRRQETE
jgi:hypothetical protein